MITAFYLSLKKIRFILFLLFLFGIFSDIFLFTQSSDYRIFPLLFLYILLCFLYSLKSRVTFIFDFFILCILFVLFIFSGPSVNTEKAAVWWILLLTIGIIQQWKEIANLDKNSAKSFYKRNLILEAIKKISSIVYFTLGPVISFKLAMSPVGKSLFRLISQKKQIITITTKYNFLMQLNIYEYLMSGYFFMGETNPYETKILRQMLTVNDSFFDIGAHIGWYSLNAAQLVGEKGTVIAFEPNPGCILELEKNKNLNNFTNLHIEKIALADKNNNLDFWIGDDMGGSLIKKNTERLTIGRKVKKVSVKTNTLDSYCQTHKIQKITLMKIDVEGAEMQVLVGAKDTLRKLSPDIIIEVIDDTLKENNTSKKELFAFLAEYDYIAYEFTATGLKRYSIEKPQETINIYFSKRKL